ncbi:MAG: hypothetical protein HC892_13950 [Saprospiraceae bacterium]|nr:hypothetical protein [Saprospiraceae bacterium]
MFRDKRTLFLVILMPFFLYPIMFTLTGKLGAEQAKKLDTTMVSVLMNPQAEGTPIHQALQADSTLSIALMDFDKSMLDTLTNTIGVKVLNSDTASVAAGQPVLVEIYANTTKDLLDNRKKRVMAVVATIKQQLVTESLIERNLSSDFCNLFKLWKLI